MEENKTSETMEIKNPIPKSFKDINDEKLNPYEQYNSMTLSYERFAC
jgi:hypothetical protein